MEDIMKMSLRSVIGSAIVAGVVLATVPTIAMEPSHEQPKVEQRTKAGDMFRNLGSKIGEKSKEHLPDLGGGIARMMDNADGKLREIAGSSIGPVFFAMACGAIGLLICDHMSKDNSQVTMINQVLGFFKILFGRKDFEKRTQDGVDAVQRSKSMDPLVNGLKNVKAATEAAKNSQQYCEQMGQATDNFVNNVTRPFVDAFTGVSNYFNSWFGKSETTESTQSSTTSQSSKAEQEPFARTNGGNGVPTASTGQSSDDEQIVIDENQGLLNQIFN
jgi:hypothetical protein